jgi:hypothetical protein
VTGRDEVWQVLEQILAVHFGRPSPVIALRREPYIYSTSFALEDLTVELADGTSLRLIRKDLGASGLLHDARIGKPSFLFEPRREIQTYQRLLSQARLGTATCYGAIVDPASARYWLFLEKVHGRELYQVGDVDVWVEVARWLAGLHRWPALRVESVEQRNPQLISYDADFYRRWLNRAKSFADTADRDQQRALGLIGEGLETALGRLAELPATFVHGEFYASNVLVSEGLGGRRICPVDWEMAGIGPGLLDLAALCTGWDDTNVQAIARGYYEDWNQGSWPSDEAELLLLVHCCQLCLAVQWLGWAPHWVPPPEHARDWLAEASQLVEGIVS